MKLNYAIYNLWGNCLALVVAGCVSEATRKAVQVIPVGTRLVRPVINCHELINLRAEIARNNYKAQP